MVTTNFSRGKRSSVQQGQLTQIIAEQKAPCRL